MRAHIDSLPPVMRQLGDVYVRKEFKTHMYGAKCSIAQFDLFLKGWAAYADKLSQEKIGQAMTDEERRMLSDEQKVKLVELEKEVKGL